MLWHIRTRPDNPRFAAVPPSPISSYSSCREEVPVVTTYPGCVYQAASTRLRLPGCCYLVGQNFLFINSFLRRKTVHLLPPRITPKPFSPLSGPSPNKDRFRDLQFIVHCLLSTVRCPPPTVHLGPPPELDQHPQIHTCTGIETCLLYLYIHVM